MFSFLFSDAHSHRLWEPEWTVGRSLTPNFHFTDVETGLTVSMAFPRQHRTSLEHNWGYSRATCAPPPNALGLPLKCCVLRLCCRDTIPSPSLCKIICSQFRIIRGAWEIGMTLRERVGWGIEMLKLLVKQLLDDKVFQRTYSLSVRKSIGESIYYSKKKNVGYRVS